MIIRKAIPKDFEKLKDIKKEFYLWECKKDPKLRVEFANKNLGIRLGKNLRQNNVSFFIAIEKGEIIAYSGGEIEINPPTHKEKFKGHLFNLYVKPDYRKKGIGKKLILKILHWFKKNKIKEIELYTKADNIKAQSLYKKNGFNDYYLKLEKRI
ncbi:GNAT family N-acetyltransferase [archaeon]|jgi:ribosomal protein S18 acetylase RimI-like enzyme|nr:GNAT family N-acetyltransferase [archaeon]MBT3450864.1 GNAT family N-acetyltransferase [archaeon]MBT6869046.1 GNAT family N-acetyltransferase [archaeon]MBT7193289.1 GNAT family N-acetyltransferase [archaeon]MBT7380297.1 GNAT family N-acetyltransferase [archaeon]